MSLGFLPFRANGGYPIPYGYLPDGSTGYWQKTLTTATNTSGSVWIKRAKLGAVQPVYDNKIYFNASNQLVAFGLTSDAVFRDVGAHMHIFWNGSGVWVNAGQVTGTGTYTPASVTNPRIGYDGTNYADMYFSDFAFWDSSVSFTGAVWAAEGLIPARPSNPDYTFADFTENGTITQVSDVPTNSVGLDVGNAANWNQLGRIDGSVETDSYSLSEGNTKVTVGSASSVTLDMSIAVSEGKYSCEFKWPTINGTSGSHRVGVHNKAGVVKNIDSSSFTTSNLIRIELDCDGQSVEIFKDDVSVSTTDVSSYSFPMTFYMESAVSTSGSVCKAYVASDMWTDTPTTGFKSLSTQNLPKVTINPQDYFKTTLDTETNIESSVASARSGWGTSYVDFFKNRDSVETWAIRFGHDSSNEYAHSTTATYQANRTLSGTDNWVCESIRISANAGTAAGAQAHTNGGGDTTVTHNLGEARGMIFLFPRNNGDVYVYHPDLTSGSLLKLNSSAAETASTRIKSVGANSFDIESAAPSDTYDYLVLTDVPGISRTFTYQANNSADGTFISLDFDPAMALLHPMDDTASWQFLDIARSINNEVDIALLPNTTGVEISGSGNLAVMDFVYNGIKFRSTGLHCNFSTVTYIGWAPANTSLANNNRGR